MPNCHVCGMKCRCRRERDGRYWLVVRERHLTERTEKYYCPDDIPKDHADYQKHAQEKYG